MDRKRYMDVHMKADSLKDSACIFDCVMDGCQFTMTLKELAEQSDIIQGAIWDAFAEERERIGRFGLTLDDCEFSGDGQRIVDGRIVNNIGTYSFDEVLMKSSAPIPGLFYVHHWADDCYMAYNSAISDKAVECRKDCDVLLYLLYGVRPKEDDKR